MTKLRSGKLKNCRVGNFLDPPTTDSLNRLFDVVTKRRNVWMHSAELIHDVYAVRDLQLMQLGNP